MVIKIYKKKRIISATGTPFSSEFVSAQKRDANEPSSSSSSPTELIIHYMMISCNMSSSSACGFIRHGGGGGVSLWKLSPRASPHSVSKHVHGTAVATAARLKGLGVIKFKSVPCECAEQHRFSSSAGELISGFISSSLLHAAAAAACPPKEGVGINGMP